MSSMKKMNNKILIGILLVLLAGFGLSRLFRAPRLESNLPENLIKLDSAEVDHIKVFPIVEGLQEISLVREGKKWMVKKGNRSFAAEQSSVVGLLGYLAGFEPQKMVSRKKEKWNTYQVGDSSTRVVVMKNDDVLAEVRIGKTDFAAAPSPGGFQNPYGGGFGNPFTYVRVENEDAVYTVSGFLEPSFNRTFNDWRDKSFLRIRQADITSLRFSYPDSSFNATLKEGRWLIDQQPADSAAVRNYLSQLEFKNATNFSEDSDPTAPALFTLEINGKNSALATVKAWPAGNDFVLSSSLQPGVYFTSSGSGLMNTIFTGRKALIKKDQ